MILVKKKTVDTCVHIHNQSNASYRHAGHVEKNAYPTPKQTLKNNAETKSSFSLQPSCGTVKSEKPT
jgi:hypothetical protein